jgi:hypothetical protein
MFAEAQLSSLLSKMFKLDEPVTSSAEAIAAILEKRMTTTAEETMKLVLEVVRLENEGFNSTSRSRRKQDSNLLQAMNFTPGWQGELRSFL